MPRKVLTFTGRVGLLLALLLGPMTTVIVGVLVGLPESIGRLLLLFAMIWVMCALVLTPVILFPPSGQSPGPPGGDGGGGGGGDDPPEPPTEPPAPSGGLPLPDADQSRERVRDHDRPRRRRVPLRRPSREPERRPARVAPDE
jgi:hypothetical protein